MADVLVKMFRIKSQDILHLGTDEDLRAETPAIYINITILPNILKKKIVVRTGRLEYSVCLHLLHFGRLNFNCEYKCM